MKKVNWRNMICVLEDESGKQYTVGSQIEHPTEDMLLLIEGGTAPHKPSSSGRVVVSGHEAFPHCYGLKWVETGEQAPEPKKIETGYTRVVKLRGFPEGGFAKDQMVVLKGVKK